MPRLPRWNRCWPVNCGPSTTRTRGRDSNRPTVPAVVRLGIYPLLQGFTTMQTHLIKVRKIGDKKWQYLDRSGRAVKSVKSARQLHLADAEEICRSPVREGYEFQIAPIPPCATNMVLWGSHPKYCNGTPIKLAGGTTRQLGPELREREAQGFTGLCIIPGGEAYPTATATA